MLAIRHLSKAYPTSRGSVQALADLSLDVAAGEFVAVQGPSGCGKTTLLLAVGGLLRPDGGQVLLDGQDVYALPPERRAALRASTVGFVFQQFHLVPYLTVLENVLAPTLGGPVPGAAERAHALLRRLGLEDRLQHVPAQLSTGQRQRTALARALLPWPRLLLADEPTGNLDEASAEAVLGHLEEFARHGGAVLLATHDQGMAARAQRVVALASPGREPPAEPVA